MGLSALHGWSSYHPLFQPPQRQPLALANTASSAGKLSWISQATSALPILGFATLHPPDFLTLTTAVTLLLCDDFIDLFLSLHRVPGGQKMDLVLLQ